MLRTRSKSRFAPARSFAKLFCIGAAASLALPALVGAQEASATKRDTEWDVTIPRGQTRDIDFTVTEGTWTSLDVSPDGLWIVFDLLGQIYRMPIGGGTAECLTQNSGIAMNVHPRISPDGKTIAFVSDRKGQMNVWLMDADGQHPRPVHLDAKLNYRWPSWAGGGQYIVATTVGGNRPRTIVMMHRDGGAGIEVLRGEVGAAPFRISTSHDGRYVYYDNYTSRSVGLYGRDDALMGSVQLQRLDLETGIGRAITAGETLKGNADFPSSGGAFAGEPSPDGKLLAFIRKVPGGTLNYKGAKFGPRSALWIRDLESGSERLAMDPVEMDLSEESILTNGTYPMYAWMPDSKGIVIHQGGKIRKLDVATGQLATIPFSARVHRIISQQATSKWRVTDTPMDVRFMRWGATSPDGKTLMFQALGRIWLQDLPNGEPRRLTPATFNPMEFQPAWSPDGNSIAFTTWQDEHRGALWVTPRAGGEPRRLTPNAGEYANPAWTPDGREVVVARGAGASARGATLVRNPYFDVVRIPAAGGAEHFVAQASRVPMPWGSNGSEAVRPSVTADGRVYFYEPKNTTPNGRGGIELSSVRLDGSERIVHARIQGAADAVVSPDGRWVAYEQGSNTYITPLPPTRGGSVVPTIERRSGILPSLPISSEGGIHAHWRSTDVVEVTSANRFYRYDLAARRADTVTVRMTAPKDIARGSIAITGARIVTLDNRRVIPSGTIVVKDGRISCVGSCSTAGVSRVVNAAGKTIIPGWIDMHAHLNHEHLGMLPAHNFESAVYLAYGVTTTFDPSTTSIDPYVAGELVDAGEMLGPRVYTSGEGIYEGDGPYTNDITSRDEALREVKRRMSWGSPMMKQYNQPTRTQRQWVVDAVREVGIRTTAEGSQDIYFKVSMIFDGHTGGEHLTVQSPLYADFLTLVAKANYVYSQTALVSGYGAWNDEYFWQESPVWQNTKLQRWIPWRELIPQTRRFVWRPESDYSKDVVSQVMTDLISLGGYTAVGSHGQQHGLGSHWDVWMLAKTAGPMTALEVASRHGARFLGVEDDLGSITVGKLADLMVLNANPLENIRNTANIQYVMKGGALYDANSLDEIWPKATKFGNYYWTVPEMYRMDDKPVLTPDVRRP